MSLTSVLSLYVPGLLGPLPGRLPSGTLARQPALEEWLAKGSKGSADDDRALLEAWAPPAQGSAALAWAGEGGEPGESLWARVTPVYLSPGGAGLQLIMADLEEAESRRLYDDLAVFLDCYGLKIHLATAGRWYLQGDELPPGRSDPSLLSGSCVDALIPRNPAALSWSRLWTELEMFLHDHPLNNQRQERGLMPVNSLWPWGVGSCPAPPVALPWRRVVSDSPAWLGWARLAGCMTAEELHHATLAGGEPTLIHYSRVYEALVTAQWGEWMAAVEYVERSLAAPALNQLSVRKTHLRRWDRVELWHAGNAPPVTLTRGQRWRLWRPRRPFEQWVE